jgi:hypothetical protein
MMQLRDLLNHYLILQSKFKHASMLYTDMWSKHDLYTKRIYDFH